MYPHLKNSLSSVSAEQCYETKIGTTGDASNLTRVAMHSDFLRDEALLAQEPDPLLCESVVLPLRAIREQVGYDVSNEVRIVHLLSLRICRLLASDSVEGARKDLFRWIIEKGTSISRGSSWSEDTIRFFSTR